MTKFEEFKKAFTEKFEGNIYKFINEDDTAFGGKHIENLDTESYDSYGSEDSTLERIYYFEDFDIFVKFEGTRSSYQGEEWDEFNEVKKVEKVITIWQ